jgi:hypothetical protein
MSKSLSRSFHVMATGAGAPAEREEDAIVRHLTIIYIDLHDIGGYNVVVKQVD